MCVCVCVSVCGCLGDLRAWMYLCVRVCVGGYEFVGAYMCLCAYVCVCVSVCKAVHRNPIKIAVFMLCVHLRKTSLFDRLKRRLLLQAASACNLAFTSRNCVQFFALWSFSSANVLVRRARACVLAFWIDRC